MERQPAYVLHRRRYGETSLLLEVFAEGPGRVGLIAKGAARSSSGRAAVLQPFSLLEMSWRGRGELPVLTGVDRLGRALLPRGNHLAACFYMNELILKLCQRGDGAPELFRAYARALLESEADMVPALRTFELALLDALGYGLDFSALDDSPYVCVEPERAPQPVVGDRPDSPYVISAATARALLVADFRSPQVQQEATRLLRATLAHYLGGAKLKSRELFRTS